MLVLLGLGLLPSPWALLVPPVLVLAGFSVAEPSMTWTGLVPNMDSFSYFFTLIVTPVFLFSGIFFPLDDIPIIVQIIAWCMPIFHAVEIIRSLVLGWVDHSLLYHAFWLLAFIVIFFKLPLLLMRRRLVI